MYYAQWCVSYMLCYFESIVQKATLSLVAIEEKKTTMQSLDPKLMIKLKLILSLTNHIEPHMSI